MRLAWKEARTNFKGHAASPLAFLYLLPPHPHTMASSSSSQTLSQYVSTLPEYDNPSSPSSPLPSLYSSLSSLRTSNPSAYRANVDWWRNHLAGAVSSGASAKGKERDVGVNRLVLTVDEDLLDGWTIEEVGRPMGIGTVVHDLAASRHLIPLREFLNSNVPITGPATQTGSRIPSARSVASFVVGKPLWWALGQLGVTGSGADDDTEQSDIREWARAKGQYVVWENLQTSTDQVLSHHFQSGRLSPLDSLYTLTSFKSLITQSQPHLTETDIQIVLKHLSRDRKVAHVEKGLVKFSASEYEDVQPITQDDRGLIAVKQTHEKLQSQIADLESRIVDRQNRAANALKSKQKSQAIAFLKEKKMLNDLLTRRLDSKSTLDAVILKIEQAAGDVQVMQSYQTSTQVLKGLLSNENLQLDKVEKTVEQLEDAVADQKEIDGVIRGAAVQGEDEIDEDELQQEMQRLEEEERKEREGEERKRREREEEERKRREKQEKEQREQEQQQRRQQEKEQQQQRQQESNPITEDHPEAEKSLAS